MNYSRFVPMSLEEVKHNKKTQVLKAMKRQSKVKSNIERLKKQEEE